MKVLREEDVREELIKLGQAKIEAWLPAAIISGYAAAGGNQDVSARDLFLAHPAMLKLRSMLKQQPELRLAPELVGVLFWDHLLQRLSEAGIPIARQL